MSDFLWGLFFLVLGAIQLNGEYDHGSVTLGVIFLAMGVVHMDRVGR